MLPKDLQGLILTQDWSDVIMHMSVCDMEAHLCH